MLIGTYGRPGPPLTAQVRAAGGTVAAGTLKAGWTQGLAAVPVSRVRRTLPFATVCVTNRGGVKLAIAGAPTAPAQAPLVAGVRQQGAVRFEYLRPGRESWWDLLPTIFHRFGLGKSHWLGGWTLALAGLLVLIGSAIAVRSLLREESL
jgi:hypothetical protein